MKGTLFLHALHAGWVRATREALGMTRAQLGARLGISRQSVQDLERAEAERRITLESLDRLAKAMGCRVALSLEPVRGSIDDMRERRARELAKAQLKPVDHPVKKEARILRGQGLARQQKLLSEALLRDRSRKLWQDLPAGPRSPGVIPAVAAQLNSPMAAYAVRPGKPRMPLGKLAQLCRKYHVRKLSLFGSAARNELKPDSDVDLLVEFETGSGVTLFDLPAMQEELSPLFQGRRIDLVTPEILENPYRRKTILPDMTTLYAA